MGSGAQESRDSCIARVVTSFNGTAGITNPFLSYRMISVCEPSPNVNSNAEMDKLLTIRNFDLMVAA